MIVMIDIPTAEKVGPLLKDGELITVTIDGITSQRKLYSHSAYSVTIDGLTNKLTIPIEWTELYRKELENMARTPMPGQTQRRPGRPPKLESQAPVERPRQDDTPSGGWLPPGSTSAGPTVPGLARNVSAALQDVGAEYQPFVPLGSAPVSANSQQEKTLAALERTEQENAISISDMLRECVDNFASEFLAIIKQFEPPKSEPEPIPMTCMNCENVDPDTWQCGKFKCFPPINVVADAKNMCPDFVESDPFA